MPSANELKMQALEREWWERVRARGALWFLVHKGLLFMVLLPAVGCYGIGWDYEPMLLVESWIVGLMAGGFVWMRKELRYRFTLDLEGVALPDPQDE